MNKQAKNDQNKQKVVDIDYFKDENGNIIWQCFTESERIALSEQPEEHINDNNAEIAFANKALFIFSLDNKFRKLTIKILQNVWFDRMILFFIVSNCIFLAIDNPNVPNALFQDVAEYVFQIIFTFEMIVKIVSLGFVLQKNTYLRSVWNVVSFTDLINIILQLDFLVVIMGWLSMLQGSSNVSAIRVIRILRPLRTISSIPSMRRLVQSILKSLPTMFDVFILFVFFLVITGTIATQLFQGLLYQRCINDSGVILLDDYGYEIFCNQNIQCPQTYKCTKHTNPDYGVSSFDNLLVSDLNIFIIISLEGWTTLMYYIRHATNSKLYDLFFHLVVIIGTFFVINLMVAVQFSYLSECFKEMTHHQPHHNVVDIKEDTINPEDIKVIESARETKLDKIKKKCMKIEDIMRCRAKPNKKPTLCCIKYEKMKTFLLKVINHKYFMIGVIILIMVNTILMAMNHHKMDTTFQKITTIGNTILTIIFCIEMIIKMLGYGLIDYLKDGFNIFDAIVVIVGLLEFTDSDRRAVTVLRAFRLLRIFKIVRMWKNLRKLLTTVLSSFKSMANLAMLMLLFIFIYALIGMQFLAFSTLPPESDNFRFSFNTFADAVLQVFVIITAENWNGMLQYYIYQFGWGVVIYYVTAVIFGNIMLLNLFLAVLLNFISENLDQQEENKKEVIPNNDDSKEKYKLAELSVQPIVSQISHSEQVPQQIIQNISYRAIKSAKSNPITDKKPGKKNLRRPSDSTKNLLRQQKSKNLDDLLDLIENEEEKIKREKTLRKQRRLKKQIKNQKKPKDQRRLNQSSHYQIQGKSLFLLSEDNIIRKRIKIIMENPYTEFFILHIIILNSLLMAIDEPENTYLYQSSTIALFENIFTGCFVVEAVFKIIMLGFVLSKKSYLRDPWNVLDFLIVVIAIINLIVDQYINTSLNFVKAIRALRSLRPLKIISTNEGLRNVMSSLIASIPSLLNVIMISLLFLLVFGILGVQLLQGALGYCNDTSIGFFDECIGNFTNSLNNTVERNWIVQFNNYDNIYYSSITFFEVTTLEAWPDIMFEVIDSQGQDLGPIRNNRPYYALLFVVFIFITTFFVMNLFISVIVDKFNEEMKIKEGLHDLTELQRAQIKIQQYMAQVKLKITLMAPKNSRIKRFFFFIVTNNKFDYFIFVVIGINTLILCIDYYNEPLPYANMLDVLNYICIGIFTIEAMLKLAGLGPNKYFKETWNKFDFAIVILSLIFIDQNMLVAFKANALRIIRVARLLRLVKALKGMRKLLKALWLSLQNIGNVSLVLFMIFFIFSVAGMDLFGGIIKGDSQINMDANFRTFYMSLTTLFRGSTGENWNYIMHDCFQQTGPMAIVYWILFQLVSKYIFLNIFVAVVFESLEDVNSSEDTSSGIKLTKLDIEEFVNVWSIFCPNKEKFMSVLKFCAFFQEIPEPLGCKGKYLTHRELLNHLSKLNLRVHLINKEGYVYFPEVLWCMVHQVLEIEDEKILFSKQVRKIMVEYKKKYKDLGKGTTIKQLSGKKLMKFQFTVYDYLCARKAIKRWIYNRTHPEKRTAYYDLYQLRKEEKRRQIQKDQSYSQMRKNKSVPNLKQSYSTNNQSLRKSEKLSNIQIQIPEIRFDTDNNEPSSKGNIIQLISPPESGKRHSKVTKNTKRILQLQQEEEKLMDQLQKEQEKQYKVEISLVNTITNINRNDWKLIQQEIIKNLKSVRHGSRRRTKFTRSSSFIDLKSVQQDNNVNDADFGSTRSMRSQRSSRSKTPYFKEFPKQIKSQFKKAYEVKKQQQMSQIPRKHKDAKQIQKSRYNDDE